MKWSEVKSLSRVWLLATPWTVGYQALRSLSVCGIFQARVLEWVAISFSRESSQPRDRTWVLRTAGRCFTIWATYSSSKGKPGLSRLPVPLFSHLGASNASLGPALILTNMVNTYTYRCLMNTYMVCTLEICAHRVSWKVPAYRTACYTRPFCSIVPSDFT